MPGGLERDLGLYATVTISVGGMIGSGIFVLPGLGTKIAGLAAVLAYLLAGVLVLPGALGKAKMATTMPESGGTYLSIDRALGPLPGTVAGVGAWFSLVFRSASALVGLGTYLLLFVPIPRDTIVAVSLGLALLLLAVNVLAAKQSGGPQAAIAASWCSRCSCSSPTASSASISPATIPSSRAASGGCWRRPDSSSSPTPA